MGFICVQSIMYLLIAIVMTVLTYIYIQGPDVANVSAKVASILCVFSIIGAICYISPFNPMIPAAICCIALVTQAVLMIVAKLGHLVTIPGINITL